MRIKKNWPAMTALALVAIAGVAIGDDGAKRPTPTPTPLKPIHQSFLDDLVGNWATKSTMRHDGQSVEGTGASSFARGLGDTAILQTYESSAPDADGRSTKMYGHGVYRVAEDEATLEGWWFSNLTHDVLRLTGPVSTSGFEITGDGPNGKMTVSLQRAPDGLKLRVLEGTQEVLTESYTRTTK